MSPRNSDIVQIFPLDQNTDFVSDGEAHTYPGKAREEGMDVLYWSVTGLV